MFTSSPSAKGSTAWYQEMDQRLKVVTREIRSFTPWKKEIDDELEYGSTRLFYSYPKTYAYLSSLMQRPAIPPEEQLYRLQRPYSTEEQIAVANSKADDSSFTFIQNKN